MLRSAIEAVQAFDGELVAKVVALDGTELPVPRFSARVADRGATGHIQAMALYAGQSVGAVRRVAPAREISRELVKDAEVFLRRPH